MTGNDPIDSPELSIVDRRAFRDDNPECGEAVTHSALAFLTAGNVKNLPRAKTSEGIERLSGGVGRVS